MIWLMAPLEISLGHYQLKQAAYQAACSSKSKYS